MKVILIRHGEIDSNRAKIYSGRSDEPLNDNGRAQAQIVAGRLRCMGVNALLTSPLRRAVETSQIIGQQISCTPIVFESFNELRMGPWEGLSESEVAERYPVELGIWNNAPAHLHLEGRETLEQLQQRALGGLIEASELSGNGNIVIVSHVAVIRALMLYATERSLNDYKKVDVPNASPIQIELDRCKLRK